jgi:hypothetical protein
MNTNDNIPRNTYYSFLNGKEFQANLDLLDTSQILAEITQELIASWPHICLKTSF